MASSQRDPKLDEAAPLLLDTAFEHRRASPRVRLGLPVQVGLPSGEIACAQIYNMSSDGIQLRCDQETAGHIRPINQSLAQASEPTLLVLMRLKLQSDIRTHALRCKAFYLLPEGEDEAIIGLRFEELDSTQRQLIDLLMSANLELAE